MTYKASAKMESGTEISFATTSKMILSIYFGTGSKAQNVKVDGTKITGNPASVVLEAGAHKISKADSAAIALIKLVPVTE